MEELLRREGYMYSQITEANLSFGAAIDKCIKEGKKIARVGMKGYLVNSDVQTFSHPVVTEIKAASSGVTPFHPTQEDMQAADWQVVE